MTNQKQLDANEARLVAALAGGDAAGFNIAPVSRAGRAWAGNTTATAERAVASLHEQPQRLRRKVKVNDDDYGDRLAVAQEVAAHFLDEVPDDFSDVYAKLQDDAEVERPAFATVRTDLVTLKDAAGATVQVDLATFGALFLDVFSDKYTTFDGRLSGEGVERLAAAATKRGLADVAAKLERFKAALKGLPLVLRPNGELWTPATVSRHDAETGKFDRAADESLEQEPATLTISAGGRSVRVDRAAFERLAASAGIQPTADLNRQEYGRVISAARDAGNAGLLGSLLRVRSDTSVLYKVRGGDGRSWKPAPASAAASETDRAAGDILAFFNQE